MKAKLFLKSLGARNPMSLKRIAMATLPMLVFVW
jgi:hypothetical protein